MGEKRGEQPKSGRGANYHSNDDQQREISSAFSCWFDVLDAHSA